MREQRPMWGKLIDQGYGGKTILQAYIKFLLFARHYKGSNQIKNVYSPFF